MIPILPSLIRRYMKGVPRFTLTDNLPNPPVSISLAPEEALVGWYANAASLGGPLLIFTSLCLYVVQLTGVTRVVWEEIVDYQLPAQKIGATEIELKTPSEAHLVHMAGSHGPAGQFPDIYCLVQVVHTVVRLNKKKHLVGPLS